MNIEDFEQFSECWGQACEGAGKQPSPKAIEWAFEVLHDKSLAEVMSGLVAHARNPDGGQFLPKPADVIRHIDGAKADRKDYATVAWARVVDNVNRYASVAFDDPAIHYALQVGFGGNWQDVCDFNSDDFAYQEKRRSFITAYANFKKGMSYQPYFVGVEELENGSVSITFIGNGEQAKLVHKGGSNSGLDKLVAHNVPVSPMMKDNKKAVLT